MLHVHLPSSPVAVRLLIHFLHFPGSLQIIFHQDQSAQGSKKKMLIVVTKIFNVAYALVDITHTFKQ